MVRTADYWHEWLARGDFPDHPWRAYLQRSALTLKGLTYAPTGAMIAAPTTSLPETPGGERNWDYRYSWIRDSTFMLWGLYTLGFDWEANDFFYFIADVAGDDDDLQVMYGIGGERKLDEYDARPPRRLRGRAAGAHRQRRLQHRQHDVWGALLDSVYLHTKSRDGLPETVWPILDRAGRAGDRRTGASPTAASGRCAASPSTSPPRRSCAGSRATAAPGWRGCARTASTPSAGRRRPTRSTPTSGQRRRRARRVHPALRHRPRSTPRCCSPLVRFLPPDDERIVNTVNAIATS